MSKAKKATIEVGSELDDWVSRSELKRQAEDYHELGRTIMALSDSQRSKLAMSEELAAACALANRIRHTKEGFRRQMQLVAKVIRNSDVDEIRKSMEQFKNRDKRADIEAAKIEKLRERMIKNGDSEINNFLEAHASADRQKLRQLVRQAAKEHKAEKPAKGFKALFKYLKECQSA